MPSPWADASAAGRQLSALVALALLTVACNGAKRPGRLPPPQRLLVRYREDSVGVAAAGTSGIRLVSERLNLYTVDIHDGSSTEAKVRQLNSMPGILYAEPDQWVRAAKRPIVPNRGRANVRAKPLPPPSPPPKPMLPFTPNDPFWEDQWGLPYIRATEAWAYARDSSSILVCIVDSGVKWDHPDLVGSLVDASEQYKMENTDDYGHGTHIAGIIGAMGNNRRGIAGTSLKASLTACKALDATGGGNLNAIIRCLDICSNSKARIINASFQVEKYSQALFDAYESITGQGIFISSAAGNHETDCDTQPCYPASYNLKGAVAVANVMLNGRLAPNVTESSDWDFDGTIDGTTTDGGSNYGGRTVELAAPGTQILSTYIYKDYKGQYYKFDNGTSMAAPFVTGAAALAMAASGDTLTNVELEQLLIRTSRRVSSLQGKVVANGVLNLKRLLIEATAIGAKRRRWRRPLKLNRS